MNCWHWDYGMDRRVAHNAIMIIGMGVRRNFLGNKFFKRWQSFELLARGLMKVLKAIYHVTLSAFIMRHSILVNEIRTGK